MTRGPAGHRPERFGMTPIEKLDKLLAEADESLERWRPFPIEMWPQDARTVAALLAALRTQGEQGWQDIATAPKDGTQVLIAGGTYEYDAETFPTARPFLGVEIARWNDLARGWEGGYGREFDGSYWYEPTHWRPIPTPPALES